MEKIKNELRKISKTVAKIEVEVGGATVFVLDVDQFYKVQVS